MTGNTRKFSFHVQIDLGMLFYLIDEFVSKACRINIFECIVNIFQMAAERSGPFHKMHHKSLITQRQGCGHTGEPSADH